MDFKFFSREWYSFTSFLILVLFTVSCSKISNEQVEKNTDMLVSSIDIVGARSIFYQDAYSRSELQNGFYKADAKGNVSELYINDASGKRTGIGILWAVNVSDRYVFIHPNPWDLGDLAGLDEYGQGDDVWKLINIICVADKQSGKLYKMPFIPVCGMSDTGVQTYNTNRRLVYQSGDKSYILGNETTSGTFSQIYVFDHSDMSVRTLLPEGQEYCWLEIANAGFVGYWGGYNSTYKVITPGGSIIVMPRKTFLLNGQFYSIVENEDDSKEVYVWSNDGNNRLVESKICNVTNDLHSFYDYWLTDNVTNEIIFENYSFDGKEFKSLSTSIPNKFFDEKCRFTSPDLYETRDAWYVIENQYLLKLNKKTYEVSRIALTEYQLLDVVSDVNESALSFVGLRYADMAKVIGKIMSDDSFAVETVIEGNQAVFNLIPLN
ncbi:MAG: hypothetical protein K2J06_07785 [Muribaculaceae bacterium]|nr:hypothetical protein [Muribaculaceae bacterium]